MKRKGIIAVLLSGTLLLAACGRESPQAVPEPVQETRISVAWWGNQERTERTQRMLASYTADHPGIRFDCQYYEFTEYWTRMGMAAAGQQLPDLLQMDYMYLRQYAESGLLLDLTPYVEDGTLDVSDVDETILDTGRVDGKLYAICCGINAPALLYNKTLLDNAGITIPEQMTVEEFETICRKVYHKTGVKTNYNYHRNVESLEYLVRGQGKVLLLEDRLGIDSPEELLPFFEGMQRAVDEGWQIAPEVLVDRTISSVEQDPLVYGSMPEETSWCAFVWSNMLSAYQEAAPQGITLGITAWPSDAPEKCNYVKPAMLLSISAVCGQPEEAARVIDGWTNSLQYNRILLAERGIPVSGTVARELEPFLGESTRAASAFVRQTILPHSAPINPSAPFGTNAINQMLHLVEEDLCYGKISAKEAAERFFTEANRILSEAAENN